MQEIEKICRTHLATIGFPFCSPEAIIREIKPMYLLLEAEGLMPLSFNVFEDIVHFEYLKSEMLS